MPTVVGTYTASVLAALLGRLARTRFTRNTCTLAFMPAWLNRDYGRPLVVPTFCVIRSFSVGKIIFL